MKSVDNQPAEEREEGSKETIRVRQGISGQGVRQVLIFSLAGIVIAFIALAFYISGVK